MKRRVPLWLLANPDLVRGQSQALALAEQSRFTDERWSVVLEGGPGHLTAPASGATITLHQLAAQCVCCVGQLPLRVTLARSLRLEKPERLVLELVHAEHLQKVRALLTGGAFADHLFLQDSPPTH